MAEPPVLFEKTADGVAILTLNRPGVLNAMNLEVRDLLWTLMAAVRDDPQVRAGLMRGAGERAFSAGADISEFGTAPSYTEARRARRERDVWGAMLDARKPFVAAIHGFAFGAGCELPLLCDIRLCSDDAQFALPEVTLGYIPSAGGTQTLPRTVAGSLARQMVLGGEAIGAEAALRAGLVHGIVPREQLDADALAVAGALATRPAAALQGAKEALVRGAGLPLPQGLAAERAIAMRVAATA